MKIRLIPVLTLLLFATAVPLRGHGCCHYYDHSHWQYPYHHGWGPAWYQSQQLETWSGQVVEVNFLRGPTPEAALVEIRLQDQNRTTWVRLGPAGFLRRSDLLPKEGDTVSIQGYRAAAADGETVLAVVITSGSKSLSLRDPRGRPLW